jgi:hypothetical protein
MIKLRLATAEHVDAVAANLRHSDDLECRYAYGISGAEALREAVRVSNIVHSICAENGEALGVCGLNGSIVWLLATDALTATPERRRALALQGRRCQAQMLRSSDDVVRQPRSAAQKLRGGQGRCRERASHLHRAPRGG